MSERWYAVGACERCGTLCRVADQANEQARLLRHSTEPKGLCPNCAMTQFLQTTEPLAGLLTARGPEVLLDPRVRLQIASILVAGCSDVQADEITWSTVVQNWGLPWKRRRTRR